MLYFTSVTDAEEIFKALSAPTRLQILKMLYESPDISMNDLAEALGLTNSAISLHIGKLQQSGLVQVENAPGKRGNTKYVRPIHNRLVIDLAPASDATKMYSDEISVGYYTDYSVSPTCGIATPDSIIGEFDDVRYFNFPDRFKAEIIWFCNGFIEYSIPNHLQAGQQLKELQISFEVSSEYPGSKNDYPSDIYFRINDVPLGYWISPGDFGDRKGYISPIWWPPFLNQYGLLKTLIVNTKGTFIDGTKKISDTTVDELGINYSSKITLRFEVPQNAVNCGGITLFGKSFGDYSQAIRVKTFYSETPAKNYSV